MLSKIKNVSLALVGGVIALSSNANAAITFSDTTGFGGTLDLNFFYSAVPLVVTAMVAVIAVGLGIKMFKKA
jgi:hypothetical protein